MPSNANKPSNKRDPLNLPRNVLAIISKQITNHGDQAHLSAVSKPWKTHVSMPKFYSMIASPFVKLIHTLMQAPEKSECGSSVRISLSMGPFHVHIKIDHYLKYPVKITINLVEGERDTYYKLTGATEDEVYYMPDDNVERFERTLLELRTKTPETVESVLMGKKKFKITTTVERVDKEFQTNLDRKVLPKTISIDNTLSMIALMEKVAWVTRKKPTLFITKNTSESILNCADADVKRTLLKFLDVQEYR